MLQQGGSRWRGGDSPLLYDVHGLGGLAGAVGAPLGLLAFLVGQAIGGLAEAALAGLCYAVDGFRRLGGAGKAPARVPWHPSWKPQGAAALAALATVVFDQGGEHRERWAVYAPPAEWTDKRAVSSAPTPPLPSHTCPLFPIRAIVNHTPLPPCHHDRRLIPWWKTPSTRGAPSHGRCTSPTHLASCGCHPGRPYLGFETAPHSHRLRMMLTVFSGLEGHWLHHLAAPVGCPW